MKQRSEMKPEDCPVFQIMKKFHICKYREICDDTTVYYYHCGCIDCHTYDDTPGWRLNEHEYDCKNCILNQRPCKIDDTNE